MIKNVQRFNIIHRSSQTFNSNTSMNYALRRCGLSTILPDGADNSFWNWSPQFGEDVEDSWWWIPGHEINLRDLPIIDRTLPPELPPDPSEDMQPLPPYRFPIVPLIVGLCVSGGYSGHILYWAVQ